MPNYNKVILAGHMTRDPELTYTQSQTAICKFGLAVSRKYKEKEEVCFVDCTAWGKTGETIQQYMAKGRPILIEGRLTHETWEAKDGTKRSRHSVTVENFQFLGSKDDGAKAPSQPQSPPQNKLAEQFDEAVPSGNDIPF